MGAALRGCNFVERGAKLGDLAEQYFADRRKEGKNVAGVLNSWKTLKATFEHLSPEDLNKPEKVEGEDTHHLPPVRARTPACRSLTGDYPSRTKLPSHDHKLGSEADAQAYPCSDWRLGSPARSPKAQRAFALAVRQAASRMPHAAPPPFCPARDFYSAAQNSDFGTHLGSGRLRQAHNRLSDR